MAVWLLLFDFDLGSFRVCSVVVGEDRNARFLAVSMLFSNIVKWLLNG